jgi:hypothetical protein
MRPRNRSGGHQPAVLWKSRLRGRFGTQSRDTSRAIKSGGRQPAVDLVTASATAFVHGRPARRRCAAIVVLPLQARYTNHGWLTPAAPDARRRCTEKTIFAVHNRMFPRAAGVSPPCFGSRACGGDWAHNHGIRRVQSRAAGVSPPWFGNSAGDGDGFSRTDYICTAHPAPAPRLAYTSRS